MAKIKEVYSNDVYYPFIVYCESHGYMEMTDLVKCRFQDLQNESDIPSILASRIKTIYVLYCKQHTSEFIPAIKMASKPSKSVVPEAEMEQKLLSYFQANADKLIHITEIVKALGKKVKRQEVIQVLEKMPWCKAVDDTTFFYSQT